MSKTADQLTIEALQASLADKEHLLEKLYDDRQALYQRGPGMGGVYRRQDREDMNKSDLLESPASFNEYENMNILWSRSARMKFRLSTCSVVEARWFHSLPYNVRSEGWWHLCAQVGIIEPLARLFYTHPENGQESTVAKAQPVQRGPIIACQGDYLD